MSLVSSPLAASTAAAVHLEQELEALDCILNSHWELGKSAVVGWTLRDGSLEALFVPNHKLSECLSDYEYLLIGSRHLPQEQLDELSRFFDKLPLRVPLAPGLTEREGRSALETMLDRYSIKKTKYRAAVLFDIVNFSIYSPLQQVMQLNSLQHSINSAEKRLTDRGIELELSRSPTGDGFYVWNRKTGLDGDTDLFFLMALALADNAVARYKGKDGAVPLLRTCFNIGSHYEFFQSESLSPTHSNYIVGDLTIELARMAERATPGQILIGSFVRPVVGASDGERGFTRVSAPMFMALAQRERDVLNDLQLSDERITDIKLYLTGSSLSDGRHNIKRYRIYDKHGKSLHVFNVKINLHRGDAKPIYLGRMDSQLGDFDAEDSVLDLPSEWGGLS